MPGTPEVLTWSARTPDPAGDADAGAPAWVDLGELGAVDGSDVGALEPPVRRLPRALLWTAGLLAVGGLAFAAVRSPGGADGGPATTNGTSTSDLGGVEPDFTVPPLPGRLDLPAQIALQASSTAALEDTVQPGGRRGDCPAVRRGHADPVNAAMRAVHAVLPGFRLLDSARTSDGFGGICLVQLRARDSHGTVLVMNVVPPSVRPDGPAQDVQSLESQRQGGSLVRTVSDSTATGWRVDVGVVGEQPTLPDLGRLGTLAGRRDLEW